MARRVARCYFFSALRAVVAWAARLVLSERLQPTARVMVVFVGSHRAWWRHLRLKSDVFQARGVPPAHISDCFQGIVVRRVARCCLFSAPRPCVRCEFDGRDFTVFFYFYSASKTH